MWLLPSMVLWTPQQKPEALPTSLGCFKQTKSFALHPQTAPCCTEDTSLQERATWSLLDIPFSNM